MSRFDHERLTVYRTAIDFIAHAEEVVGRLPKGRAYLADQLHRAATSIALNIAEGAGEYRPRDKARFYRMALRSATECAALLDICRRLALIEDTTYRSGYDLLDSIAAMLTQMAKRFDGTSGKSKGPGEGGGEGAGEG
jgi:four helix bundle protein